MKRMIMAALVVILISSSVPVLADDDGAYEATAMIVDVVLGRPLGIAATVIGTAFFIVALPFAALSGSVKPVGRTLVAEPFKFTFTRPVGDFSQWE